MSNQDVATKNYVDRMTITTVANLSDNILRRDGANMVDGTIDMDGHSIKSITDPTSNQDVVTKNYVDKNTIILLKVLCVVT